MVILLFLNLEHLLLQFTPVSLNMRHLRRQRIHLCSAGLQRHHLCPHGRELCNDKIRNPFLQCITQGLRLLSYLPCMLSPERRYILIDPLLQQPIRSLHLAK